MANIGTFKKSGDTNYTGEIVTMSLQKKNVTIVAEEASEKENAPSHRVFVAKAEIGAAWTKTSKEGRDYLSIKLDDPSFNAPIFASLFADEDAKTFNLIWSRARTSNGNCRPHPRPARHCRSGLRRAVCFGSDTPALAFYGIAPATKASRTYLDCDHLTCDVGAHD